MKKFNACSCSIHDQVCIFTGFNFNHDDKWYVGDLFKCNIHPSLSIHGISWTRMSYKEGLSTLEGYITFDDAVYGIALGGGTIDLNEKDLEYIARYHDLTPLEIKP